MHQKESNPYVLQNFLDLSVETEVETEIKVV